MGDYVAFYARVSTDPQDVGMQVEAAGPFLKDVPKEKLLMFVDRGVSALKVPISLRTELQRMLDAIWSGKVGTLVVYERDRLARNPYEYMDIVNIIRENNVKVVFTATGSHPFDNSIITEGILAIAAAAEGKTIQRRSVDSRSYPASLFGFERRRDADGVKYFVDKGLWASIWGFFNEVAESNTEHEFVEAILKHKRLLNRSEGKLLSMLQNPFYAGYRWANEELERMQHVEQLVELELFERVGAVIKNSVSVIQRLEPISLPGGIPICGVCGRPMRPKFSIAHAAKFSCSSGHSVNAVDVNKLKMELEERLRSVLTGLNTEKLRVECVKFVRRVLVQWKAHAKPGGTWRDWDSDLIADCHQKSSGKTYPGVYGRMTWDDPAPTITTQFYGFGNGRFGHPAQDRALSLREGAILQSFPENYQFVAPGEPIYKATVGRLIGNAVPVKLGEVIGKSILAHVAQFEPQLAVDLEGVHYE